MNSTLGVGTVPFRVVRYRNRFARPLDRGTGAPTGGRQGIFSAQAKGAFQCQEISPCVRFALEQSGESRRQVRDALGAGEAKDRHELARVASVWCFAR